MFVTAKKEEQMFIIFQFLPAFVPMILSKDRLSEPIPWKLRPEKSTLSNVVSLHKDSIWANPLHLQFLSSLLLLWDVLV